MYFTNNRASSLRPIRSNRIYNWNRCGVDISKADSLESALNLAQLNWNVGRMKLFIKQNGQPRSFEAGHGIYRLDEKGAPAVELGMGGKEFTPIQNATAFKVCEMAAGKGAQWDRGGSELNGVRNWVRMQIVEKEILGDIVSGFVIARNSHVPGESFTLRAYEEREICTNGLTAMIPGAMLVNMRHTLQVKDLEKRVEMIMVSIRQRMEELTVLAERAAKIHLTETRWTGLVNTLLPFESENPSDRNRKVVNEQRSILFRTINAPDLANHVTNQNGLTIINGWAALNAVADFSSHLNDAQKSIREDRISARLTDLAVKDDMLQTAREFVFSAN